MHIHKNECYYLGRISKVLGYKGEMVWFIDADDPHAYRKLKRVLVDLNGLLSPFFVQRIAIKDKGFAHVLLEGVTTRDDAATLAGNDLYLPLSELPPLSDHEYYLHELEGMEVNDTTKGTLGKVERVLDYSNNPLLQVFSNGFEVLIPITDVFVKRVDKKARVVHVEVPSELLEMNKM
jgi:16S rRNA processing protein RimM